MADRLTALAAWASAAVVAIAFVWIVGLVVASGAPRLSIDFLIERPADAGRAGGIGPLLVSTLAVLAICLAVSLPVGLGSAILLAEFESTDARFARLVRRSLDVLAGIPSIVFGLFGNAFFCRFLGLGFSIAAGGLTLACMVLPVLIRSTEAGLRAVPDTVRLGAAALGLSRTGTIRHLLLPAALPGLAAGVVLGVGRALAETAALLFTSGAVDRLPTSPSDSGRTLSVHIYEMSMNVAGGDRTACATAAVLVALLALVNAVATGLARRLGAR